MKILITQLGTIGDMILLTPAIKALNEKYPDAQIFILAGSKNYLIVENNPRISGLLVFKKNPNKLLKLISYFKQEKYNYYIDPKDHYSSESAWIARRINADYKIGFNNEKSAYFNYSILGSKDNDGLHFIERCFNALKFLNIEKPPIIPLPELFTNSKSEEKILGFIHSNSKENSILVNISAGSSDRMWDLDNWIDVINELRKEYSIILTYKPADARYARIILNHTKDITHFPNLILNELIVLVKYAQLVVTPDTSLVHIASAFDKPLVALYSSNESNFKKFAPLSSLNIALRASDNSDKINSISVSSVLNAVNNLFINIPHI